MSFFDRFISASANITSPDLRLRAELSAWLILGRTFLMAALLSVFHLMKFEYLNPLAGAVALSAVSYLVTRTKYFEVGVFAVIIEPIVAIPTVVFAHRNSILVEAAPIFLTMGPLLASFLLRGRAIGFIIAATMISFIVILIQAPDDLRPLVGAEFTSSIFISSLALLGLSLRDRADRAIEAERAKVLHSAKLLSLGDMANGIAHELNTPLATIMLNSELAAAASTGHEASDQQVRRYLVDIELVAQRMGKIISGLKAFSRDDSQDEFQLVDARLCVSDALRLCEQKFRDHGVEILWEDTREIDLRAPLRRHQVAQAISNLLTNSFEAIQHENHKWIRIQIQVVKEQIEIAVVDSGQGITTNLRDRVFDPFFTTKGYSQTGLGLSISKGIAQSHEGDLVYDSASVQTRFVLKLPLAS